jgi:uncharacterized membrane protein YphA (DoxX/SURF4 family)
VLLRALCAASAFSAISAYACWPGYPFVSKLIAVVFVLMLVIGFATRVIAVLVAIVVAWGLGHLPGDQLALGLGRLGLCSVLALTGGGAFSADARMFGRRIVSLTPRSPIWGKKR